jgi:hypothetical protein
MMGVKVGTALDALRRPGNLGVVAREATAWVEQALRAVKSARDNLYDDDEVIAGEILWQVQARKKQQSNYGCVGDRDG